MTTEIPVLCIDFWRSKCMNCGKDADPNETSHQSLLGWDARSDSKGCGIVWTKVTTSYIPAVQTMRFDLEWVDFSEVIPLVNERVRSGS